MPLYGDSDDPDEFDQDLNDTGSGGANNSGNNGSGGADNSGNNGSGAANNSGHNQ